MKVVFCDVDGTFQGLSEQLPVGNQAAVAALQAQGDRFVFVTGRGLQLMDDFMAEEGLACDVIFANGAGVKYQNQEAVIRHPLQLTDIETLLQFLKAHQVLFFVHTTENVVMQPLDHYRKQLAAMETTFLRATSEGAAIAAYKKHFFEEVCLHAEDVVGYLAGHPHEQIMKIELLELDPERLAWLKAECQTAGHYIFQSYYATLEIVDVRSTKGAAIEEYVAALGQQVVKTYGIGDGENDVTMWQAVDVPIAVANAADDLHQHVEHITLSCQAGGVGHFIREHLLVGK